LVANSINTATSAIAVEVDISDAEEIAIEFNNFLL
jgi:hypothetical protein